MKLFHNVIATLLVAAPIFAQEANPQPSPPAKSSIQKRLAIVRAPKHSTKKVIELQDITEDLAGLGAKSGEELEVTQLEDVTEVTEDVAVRAGKLGEKLRGFAVRGTASQDEANKRAMKHLRVAEEALQRAMRELGKQREEVSRSATKSQNQNPLLRIVELQKQKEVEAKAKVEADPRMRITSRRSYPITVHVDGEGSQRRFAVRSKVDSNKPRAAEPAAPKAPAGDDQAKEVLIWKQAQSDRRSVEARDRDEADHAAALMSRARDAERRDAERVAARDRAEAARTEAALVRKHATEAREAERAAARSRRLQSQPQPDAALGQERSRRPASGAHDHPELWRELEALRREVDRIRGEMQKFERSGARLRSRTSDAPRDAHAPRDAEAPHDADVPAPPSRVGYFIK